MPLKLSSIFNCGRIENCDWIFHLFKRIADILYLVHTITEKVFYEKVFWLSKKKCVFQDLSLNLKTNTAIFFTYGHALYWAMNCILLWTNDTLLEDIKREGAKKGKRNSNTGISLWIMQNFWEQFFTEHLR